MNVIKWMEKNMRYLLLIAITLGSGGLMTACVDDQPEAESNVVSKPHKVIVYHRENTSYMEVYQKNQLQLFKRPANAVAWQPLLQWHDYHRAWEHTPDDKQQYFSVHAGNSFELFSSADWEPLYKINISMAESFGPLLLAISEEARLLAVPYLNEDGRKVYSMHFSADGERWQPWQANGIEVVRDLRVLRKGQLAVRDAYGSWQLLRINVDGKSQPLVVPGFPERLDVIKGSVESGWLAIGMFDAALRKKRDQGFSWYLYEWQKDQWVQANKKLGLEPYEIANVIQFSKDIVMFEQRQKTATSRAYKHRYFHIGQEGMQPLQQSVKGLPASINTVKSLAKGLLLAVTEADDANGNGIAGEYSWIMQDAAGQWQLPQKLLPGAPERIWDVVQWNHGNGLGVQAAGKDGDAEAYSWSWYVRAEDGTWQAAKTVVEGFPSAKVYSIRDIRDGLIEVQTADTNQLLMQVEDGSWHNIQRVLETIDAGEKSTVVAADARSNSLLLDVQRRGEPKAERELYYYDRNGSWVRFDASSLPTH